MNNKKLLLIISPIILIGVILLIISNPQTSNAQGMELQISGCMPEYNEKSLIEDSDLIVIGKVKKVLPSQLNNDSELKDLAPVYTDNLIKINEILKGDKSLSEISVRTYKGTVDGLIVTSDGYPDFKEGEEVMLFLFYNTDLDKIEKGHSSYVLVGLSQGKYTRDSKNTELFKSAFITEDILTRDKVVTLKSDIEKKSKM